MRGVPCDRAGAKLAAIERRMEPAGGDAQRIFPGGGFYGFLSIYSAARAGSDAASGGGSTAAGGCSGRIACEGAAAEYSGMGGVAGADANSEAFRALDRFGVSTGA